MNTEALTTKPKFPISATNGQSSIINKLKNHPTLDILNSVIELNSHPAILLDQSFHIYFANSNFFSVFAADQGEISGRSLFTIQNGIWNSSSLKEYLRTSLQSNKTLNSSTIFLYAPIIGAKVVTVISKKIVLKEIKKKCLLVIFEDLTESEKYKSDIERVYQSGLRLLMPLHSQETYVQMASDAMKLFSGIEASIFVKNKDNIKRLFTTNQSLLKVQPRKNGLTHKAFRSQQPFISPVARGNPMLKAYSSVRSVISVPLIYKNKSLGILTILCSKDEKYMNKFMQSLNLFSLIASLALMKSRQYDKLLAALKKRDLFLSLASHELKTPLTVVKSYAQIIHRKVQKQQPVKSEWTESLLRESDRLTGLIEELTQLNNIRKGQLDFEFRPVSVKELVKKVMIDIRINFPEAKINFRNSVKENQDIVKGDFLKLYQVVVNLLSNAIKYSPDGKTIDVTLISHEGYIVLAIKDKGCGISEIDLPHIFEDFYRGKNSTKGMGLGLFLAKKIVEKHAGLIKVKSIVGSGSTFQVLLPILNGT